MKREQIIFGIHAGYDEISKMYQTLFKAPMIFLLVLDPEIGPAILRVILALVSEEGVDIDEATTEFDDDDYGVEVDPDLEWGAFHYDDPDERPEVEKIWYEWLSHDRKNIAHWFQLLGWHRAVILNELKKLSQETESHDERPEDSPTPLHDFFVM